MLLYIYYYIYYHIITCNPGECVSKSLSVASCTKMWEQRNIYRNSVNYKLVFTLLPPSLSLSISIIISNNNYIFIIYQSVNHNNNNNKQISTLPL